MTILNQRVMRQAITTKWIGPTNTKGSRVKASCEAGNVTVHWDHALNADGNHAAAAQALADKLHWDGDMIGGGLNGSGYAFVFVEKEYA